MSSKIYTISAGIESEKSCERGANYDPQRKFIDSLRAKTNGNMNLL